MSTAPDRRPGTDAAPAGLRAEFTIEPFVPGNPGPHVRAAIDACSRAGLDVEVEPFGTRITGEDDAVLAAVASLTRAAFDAGATRVSLQAERTVP